VLAVNTTVVVVVDGEADADLDGFRAANVRVLHPEPGAPVLDRAVEAWGEVRRTSTRYVVHDADPLAWVAGAWTRRFDGQGPIGELEVAIAETLARWRAGSIDLPDYYLLVEPEDLDVARRHWFIGVLGAASPARVIPARNTGVLVDRLGELPPGRWWPPLDRLVGDLERTLPEQAGLIGAQAGLIGAQAGSGPDGSGSDGSGPDVGLL
jgi:hypothetical protein